MATIVREPRMDQLDEEQGQLVYRERDSGVEERLRKDRDRQELKCLVA